MTRPTAAVYIDGFNLYKGALERRPQYKWLDLVALAQNVLTDYEVRRVHYFTARIRGKADPTDPERPNRQQAYLRALERHCDPEVLRIDADSQFAVNEGTARRRFPKGDQRIEWVEVWKVQEKGSDVKLAVQLVVDSMTLGFDSHWVLSADSDLCPAMCVARAQGKEVGVIYPAGLCGEFERAGFTRKLHLHDDHLAASQLPDRLEGVGLRTLYRPPQYKAETPALGGGSEPEPEAPGGLTR